MEKLKQYLDNFGQFNLNLTFIGVLLLLLGLGMKQCSDTNSAIKTSEKNLKVLSVQIDSLKLKVAVQEVQFRQGINIDSVVNAKLFGPLKLKQEISSVRANVNSLNSRVKSLKAN